MDRSTVVIEGNQQVGLEVAGPMTGSATKQLSFWRCSYPSLRAAKRQVIQRCTLFALRLQSGIEL
jgi:hypothetical protein